MIRKLRIALVVTGLATALVGPALADPVAPAAAAATCPATVVDLARLNHTLVRTARRLAAGLPITIVAVGSSSTAGAGASSPSHSYPNRLAVELQQLFPGHPITILNRGANGEEAFDTLLRFEQDVLAEKPDLVLWQVGTNSLLRERNLEDVGNAIHQGVLRLKAAAADVVLMDPQFAPQVLAMPGIGDVNGLIALLAKQDNVNLFQRFAVMQSWREASGIPFATFLSPDELHMNDWGYGCLARILAGAIAEAASRPALTAETIAR
jgi:lysophospholipase L1-like esterase